MHGESHLKKMSPAFDPAKLKLITEEAVIPFQNDSFDIVVAWQVLYYNSFVGLQKVLKSLYDVLKKKGMFIGTMAMMKDSAIQHSVSISKYERMMNSVVKNQAGSLILGLPEESDIREVFSVFQNLEIGYFESKINNFYSAHWVITGIKE